MTAIAFDADVVAAAGGDTQAYTRLVSANRNLVCSIAFAIVRDVGASEDIAQGVFVAGWQSLRKLRNPASFQPWLRQLTRNKAHEHIAPSNGVVVASALSTTTSSNERSIPYPARANASWRPRNARRS
jgi:DNA-directed RNA polymerase specialized sigma24 family protein